MGFRVLSQQLESECESDRFEILTDVFMERTNLIVSHLEFVTLSGLETLLKDLLMPDNAWFPVSKLFNKNESSLKRLRAKLGICFHIHNC